MRTQFSLGVVVRVRQLIRSADKGVKLVACGQGQFLEHLRAAAVAAVLFDSAASARADLQDQLGCRTDMLNL